jgi:hypothetical protein
VLHLYSSHFTNIGFFDPNLSIERDRGYAEIWQYGKTFVIILLLLGISLRRANRSYLSWAGLFLYFLLDDSLTLHERLGQLLANHLGYVPGLNLRAKDFGELTFIGLAALVFGTLLALTWFRGDATFRSVSKRLALLVGLVVVFGVGLDMVHIMAEHIVLRMSLAIVEDGGEMVAISLILWYVQQLFKALPPSAKTRPAPALLA